jgi:hypothetical protein
MIGIMPVQLALAGGAVFVSDGIDEPLFLACFLYCQVEYARVVDLEELR